MVVVVVVVVVVVMVVVVVVVVSWLDGSVVKVCLDFIPEETCRAVH